MNSKLPLAAILAVSLTIGLTFVSFLGVHFSHRGEKELILLVGDSFTGNYRYQVGERLQDYLQKELPEQEVINLGAPGSRILDVFLQVHQAEQLWRKPTRVYFPYYVDKLVYFDDQYTRFDKFGDNLRWLLLEEESQEFIATLDEEHRRKLGIHKMGLLAGYYDLLELYFRNQIQWPFERREMLKDSPKRRAKIIRKTEGRGKAWAEFKLDTLKYLHSKPMQDFEMMLKNFKQKEIQLIPILLPLGNPNSIREFPAKAQQNLAEVHQLVRRQFERQGLEFIDLVEEMEGEWYDDFRHTKDPKANQKIVQSIVEKERGE